jgi:uncharacterized membrane protein
MNSTQSPQTTANAEQRVTSKQPIPTKIQAPEKKPLTLGQKVADRMASKVGSWAFLIGQSAVLTGWVGFNLMPGVPHWDQSPFILLNLVFSFASAYTAPVVLMSQNRQSEEDRESASHNYQVTLQAAQNLELLHEKLDAQYSAKLDELTVLIKQQQAENSVKVVFVPTQVIHAFDHQSSSIAKASILNAQPKDTVFVTVANAQSLASDSNLDDLQVLISK